MLHDLETATTLEIPTPANARIHELSVVTDDGDLYATGSGEEAAAERMRTGVVRLDLVWRRPR